MKYRSRKVGKYIFEVAIPKRTISINVQDSLNVVEHKGRWIVALAHEQEFGTRYFRSNQVINRSQAIKIVNFLLDYINLVKPTQATAIHASIKALNNQINKNATEFAAIALKSESES